MLSGDGQKATKRDVRIVRGAMREYLGVESNGYAPFANDTFRHFCARKTQVILNLSYMAQYIENEDFMCLVMNEVKKREGYAHAHSDVNLFMPVLFEVMKNAQELVIKAKEYAFDLVRLSMYTFPNTLKGIMVNGNWVKDAFTDRVKQMVNGQGWKADLENVKARNQTEQEWTLKLSLL